MGKEGMSARVERDQDELEKLALTFDRIDQDGNEWLVEKDLVFSFDAGGPFGEEPPKSSTSRIGYLYWHGDVKSVNDKEVVVLVGRQHGSLG